MEGYASRALQLPLTTPDKVEISWASELVICRQIKRESEMAIRLGFVHATPRRLIARAARGSGRLRIHSQLRTTAAILPSQLRSMAFA
jgi:hypothetical protein